MSIKRLFAAVVSAGLPLFAFAQEEPDGIVPGGFTLKDTVVYVQSDRVDKSLEGLTVSEALPWCVRLSASEPVLAGMQRQIEENAQKLEDGYRIRIFLDNKQDSREKSLAAENHFRHLFPGFNTYRTYTYPFFKVTVGDFRTKADAQASLPDFQRVFPTAFVVKEKMKYPVIDRSCKARRDTLTILVRTEAQTLETVEL